jgi:hypothetical protein
MLPSTDQVWSDIEYARQYGGEKKLMSEFLEYEKITGKNWADELLAFDPISQSMEKFHKEVIIPLLCTH